MGRKNVAFIKEIYAGKLTKALIDRVNSMLYNSKVSTDKILKLILDYYKLMASEKIYENIEKKLSKLSAVGLKNLLSSKDFHLHTIVEPFAHLSFENINTAAKLLKVELDEYVEITDDNGRKIKSDVPVPVGISYVQFLEHFSSKYLTCGGAKYSFIIIKKYKKY